MGGQQRFVTGEGEATLVFEWAGSSDSAIVRIPHGARVVNSGMLMTGNIHGEGWASPVTLSVRDGENEVPIIETRPSPDLADLDGDGDLDLVCGIDSYGTDRQGLPYYENIGTEIGAEWQEESYQLGKYRRFDFPDLIDIDSDGDLDLVIGQENGTVRLYRNTGDRSSPIWSDDGMGPNSMFAGIDDGSYAIVDFCDIDDDDELDMVCGGWYWDEWKAAGLSSYDGHLVGGSYCWSQAAYFDGIETDSYANPALADLDGDGDFDLLVGNYDGTIALFENVGTRTGPAWVKRPDRTREINVGWMAAPTVGDLDGDGVLDIVVGAASGQIFFYKGYRGFPSGLVMDLDGIGHPVWTHLAELSTTVLVDGFSADLATCLEGPVAFQDEWGNAFNDVRINLTSGTPGEVTVHGLDIEYEYSPTTVDFSPFLNEWINDHRDDAGPNGDIEVPIIVDCDSGGVITLSDLRIEASMPPVWTEIPSMYAIDEDTCNDTLIDLWAYVTDDFTDDANLTIDVVQLDRQGIVGVYITDGRYVGIDAGTGDLNDEWSGAVKVMARATDSEGLTSESKVFEVRVRAVDDPPEISDLGNLTAVEGTMSVFDITPYLHDIDTPLGSLTVRVGSDYCNVVGYELRFLFDAGGFEVDVPVWVSDGHSEVTSALHVRVIDVDRPPVFLGPFHEAAHVGVPITISLAGHVLDDDTPEVNLGLRSSSPVVVRVSGLNLTLLCGHSGTEKVSFVVTDGTTSVDGWFWVDVTELYEPPAILGPDGNVSLDEGSELWLDLIVRLGSDGYTELSVESGWPGLTVSPNRTLHVIAGKGEVGTYGARVIAKDMSGGEGVMELSIRVLNVNDAPHLAEILSPMDRSTYSEGSLITFSVIVFDPDTAYGDMLNITWSSSRSGQLRSIIGGPEVGFTTDRLAPGRHNITITVSDGRLEDRAWIEVIVTPRSHRWDEWGIEFWALLLCLVAIPIALVMVWRDRKVRRGRSSIL